MVMMFFGWLFFIIVLVLLIRPDYFRKLPGNSNGESEYEAGAIEILKERYAKGEIGEEEYLDKLKKLRGGN
ncbi:conserved hypothetical protein [Kosmotoga olearia TBF 19.5.1]|uniref:SHOCT domain-containing protein n=2 Tax=Kosmotoga TaxID=651456 RepID=C5CIZ6_KOSOT|nr:conserved hypothetical protein [Kosmotoga olearia TBF 19.5.1]